jgi:hypothetical protein
MSATDQAQRGHGSPGQAQHASRIACGFLNRVPQVRILPGAPRSSLRTLTKINAVGVRCVAGLLKPQVAGEQTGARLAKDGSGDRGSGGIVVGDEQLLKERLVGERPDPGPPSR